MKYLEKIMNKSVQAKFRPNYLNKCLVCEGSTTVDIYVDNKLETETVLCGACTWGEADCINPENW